MNWENGLRVFGGGFWQIENEKVFVGAESFWWVWGFLAVESFWGFLAVESFWGFLGFLARNMAKMFQNRLFFAIVAIETIY